MTHASTPRKMTAALFSFFSILWILVQATEFTADHYGKT